MSAGRAERDLFGPVKLGERTLRNRIVMAPMSRHRANAHGVPGAACVTYYRQRAQAGLVISEGIYPSDIGKGYMFTPGLTSEQQRLAWHNVTDAVHEEGGTIFAQLMHVGRLSDSLLLPEFAEPMAPSAVRPDPNARHYSLNAPRVRRLYGEPRAMSRADIDATIASFGLFAERAVAAGFDGVELHAGSGYLPMQFLSPNTNLRIDDYGGDLEGRCRFPLRCIDVMSEAIGSQRVAIKISPGLTFNDVFDTDPEQTYTHLASELDARNIAYLQVGNFGMTWDVYGAIRTLFSGTLIGVGGFDRASAAGEIASGRLDLVAFGRAFIANPDLVARLLNKWPLRMPDRQTYYTQGVEGYLDYPVYDPESGLDPTLAMTEALAVGRPVGGS